jgi:hypothetical protein
MELLRSHSSNLMNIAIRQRMDASDHIWRGMGWKGDSPVEPLDWMLDLLEDLFERAIEGRSSLQEVAESIRQGLALPQLPAWLSDQLRRLVEAGAMIREVDLATQATAQRSAGPTARIAH